MHTPPAHAVGVDVAVSHKFPQPPQSVMVLMGVSHPFEFIASVSQSAKPDLHPVYVHFPPTQVPPRLCVVSHARVHGAVSMGAVSSVSSVSAASFASSASIVVEYVESVASNASLASVAESVV